LSTTLLVVENPANWPLHIPGVEVVAARSFLADSRFSQLRRARIFNLCRSYRYQSLGYYVSLLAEARGQKPIPSVTTIQDLKSLAIFRSISEELDEQIQRSLAPIRSEDFTLSIYFGKNVARRYDRLSLNFFRLFEAPLLRAEFRKTDRWEIRDISPISLSEVPSAHRPFLAEAAKEYLEGRRSKARRRNSPRFDLAILWDPKGETPASDERAIKRFVSAGESLDISVEVIDRGDFGRVAEFDALFIRDTTSVNHYTYRFSRLAAAEGLVVIDDPNSILKCANKVYLAEMLERHRIATPKTMIVSRSNADRVVGDLGLPCILKQPDSSFSQGVTKVTTPDELTGALNRLLDRSELIIAQEFLPTPFDWRIGIIDREPMFVCRYYMARRHWQIIKQSGEGRSVSGRVETLAVHEAPSQVVRVGLRAANLIGDGFYGVDVKQVGRRLYVIEVNDNPSVDAGYEDAILRDQLYLKVMSVFVKRLNRIKGAT
jgi:glutathione synthase/RimK-type ligase-like ATP-grasp enzyme